MGNPQISVFSYIDFPAGKTSADHVKNEQEVWKPVHDARVKDSTMKGELRINIDRLD